jgi:phosphoglycolate phosphatase
LATSNLKCEAIQKLKRFGLIKYFSYIIGNEFKNKLGRFKKSKVIIKLLKRLRFNKDEVILIGDRDVDYDIAKEAGLKNILLVEYGWGYFDKHKTRQQKVIIKKPSDIIKAIYVFC